MFHLFEVSHTNGSLPTPVLSIKLFRIKNMQTLGDHQTIYITENVKMNAIFIIFWHECSQKGNGEVVFELTSLSFRNRTWHIQMKPSSKIESSNLISGSWSYWKFQDFSAVTSLEQYLANIKHKETPIM